MMRKESKEIGRAIVPARKRPTAIGGKPGPAIDIYLQ